MLQVNYTFSEKQNKNIRLAYLCSFLMPVLILAIIFICARVFPFGKECYLRTDMYHQYAPFLSEFREKLQSGGSLLYSWDVGMGVNFTALYAYYLASPFNWLVILCPKEYVIEFMMLMTVIKTGLSGLAMAFYLKHHSKSPDFGLCFFAIFYALSGYFCAYYWNVMWMDCIILFPLIVYSLEKLIGGGSGILYAIVLGISILSNYYISIMICMFLAIYFFVYQLMDRPEDFAGFVKRGFRFAFYSLLAGGLAAVLLLPEMAALRQTASADVNFPKTISSYFSIVEMLSRHLPMVETEQALEHWPNIYMGSIVFILLPVYLVTPGIRLSEKAVYLSMLFFFLAGFAVNVLNFIWHGLHYPNSLPARQSFIYIFLMLYVCFRAYSVRRFITRKQLQGAVLFAIAFILYSENAVKAEHFSFWVFYLAIVIVLLYAGIMVLYLRRSITVRRAAVLTLCLVLCESAANAAYTSITTTSREAYTEDNQEVRALVDSLLPASDFFRVEKISRKTKNDGAWMNFPSVSLFSSLANADCTAFFKKLGCEASTNAYSITGSTPFVNMLLSIKYGIYSDPQENGREKTFIESRGETYLYENNYTLPLGFVLPGELESWMLELDNPATVQNSICDMLGTASVLVPNSELGNSNGKSFAATIGETGEYYAYIKNHKVKKVNAKWADKKKSFENVSRGYLLELGTCYEGELLKLESETDVKDMEAELYRFDYNALEQAYMALSQSPLKLTVWEDAYLKGNVNSPEGGRLFLSIPYDEGWKLKVDGRDVPLVKVFDTFLGAELEAGEHEIELSFMPEGLKLGAVISLAAFAILLLNMLIEAFLFRRRRLMEAEAEYLDEDMDEFYQDYEAEAEGGMEELEEEFVPEPEEDTEPKEDIEPKEEPEDELDILLRGRNKQIDYMQLLEKKADIETEQYVEAREPEIPVQDGRSEIERLVKLLEDNNKKAT